MKWPSFPGRVRSVLPYFGLVLLVLAVFGRTLTYGFLSYDDDVHVWRDPYIFPWHWDCIAYFWTYPFHRVPLAGMPPSVGGVAWPFQLIYTPVSFTAMAVLARLGAPSGAVSPGQLNAFPFHLANVALHALNAVLLFQLLRIWFPSRAAWPAAALFAIHPVQVEAVAWVTGLNNLLGTAFGLSALLLYFRSGEQSPSKRSIGASLLCFAVALLCKPSLAALAPMLAGLDWYFRPASWKSRIPVFAVWLVLAAAAGALNSTLRTSSDLGLSVPLAMRPFVTTDSLAFYLTKTLVPWPLVPDYGRRPSWVITQTWIYWTGLFPVGLAAVLGWTSAREEGERGLWTGLALAFALWTLALLPTSGIVPYYFQTVSSVADRYLYLALIPAALALAIILDRLGTKSQVPALGFILVAALAAAVQTGFWKDDTSLWTHTLAYSPRSWLARFNLASLAAERHDDETRIRLLREAAALRPGDWLADVALADALYDAGRKTEARPMYKAAILAFGGYADSRRRYGELLEDSGDIEGAANQYYVGTKIDPADGDLAGRLGTVLVKLGQFDRARDYLNKALQLGYDPAKAHLALGIAAGQQKQFEIAAREFQAAGSADEKDFQAKFNLALAFRALGRTPEALRAAQEAVALRPESKPARDLVASLQNPVR